MAGELEKQGMNVIAIPHNSNASKGMMFPAEDSTGKPLDRGYAEMRNRFEPLIEMMQVKGNSEVHRWFWAADEFADFENADSLGDYSGRELKAFGKRNWVRWGLGKGLAYREVARRQPVPVRLRRRHRQPQRHAVQRRRGQLHRRAAMARPTRQWSSAAPAKSAAGSRARISTRAR